MQMSEFVDIHEGCHKPLQIIYGIAESTNPIPLGSQNVGTLEVMLVTFATIHQLTSFI